MIIHGYSRVSRCHFGDPIQVELVEILSPEDYEIYLIIILQYIKNPILMRVTLLDYFVTDAIPLN